MNPEREAPDLPSLRERIGGRWAISWQATVSGIVLVVILATFSGGGIGVSAPTVTELPLWFSASCVGGMAVALYIFVGNITVFRRRRLRPLPVWVVVAFHAGIGVVFALVFIYVSRFFGLAFAETPVEMCLGFSLAGLWFCMSMALLLDARDRYYRDRSILLEDAVSLEMSQVHQSRAIDRLQGLLARTEGTGSVRLDVDSGAPLLPLEAWWSASSDVRSGGSSATLESSLRQAAEFSFPRPGITGVVQELITHGSISALGTAAVFVIAYYRPVVQSEGIVVGLAAVTLVAAGLAVALVVATLIPGPAVVRLTAGIALTCIAGYITVYLFAPPLSSIGLVGLVIVIVVGAAVFVLLPSAVRTLQQYWRSTNDHLRDRITERLAQQRFVTSEVAQAAGSVEVPTGMQPAVLAVAAGLAKAAKAPGSKRLASALEWSVAALEELDGGGMKASLAEGLAGTIAPWLGLTRIELDVTSAAGRLDGPARSAAMVLVEEGLAYTCGQAAAEQVTVLADTDGWLLDLAIRHDGEPLSDDVLPPDSRWHVGDDPRVLVARIALDS